MTSALRVSKFYSFLVVLNENKTSVFDSQTQLWARIDDTFTGGQIKVKKNKENSEKITSDY